MPDKGSLHAGISCDRRNPDTLFTLCLDPEKYWDKGSPWGQQHTMEDLTPAKGGDAVLTQAWGTPDNMLPWKAPGHLGKDSGTCLTMMIASSHSQTKSPEG